MSEAVRESCGGCGCCTRPANHHPDLTHPPTTRRLQAPRRAFDFARFEATKKSCCRSDSANLIDTKKGGAGLGLFKILYSSHALICNVDPGRKTEVIALIDIQHQVRDFSKMARSVHYFATE